MILQRNILYFIIALLVFSLVLAQSEDWNVANVGLDIDRANQRINLDETTINLAKQTLDKLDITIEYKYQEGNTIIRHRISPKNRLIDFSYVLEIPKCFAETLDSVEFEDKQFKIIEEDPILGWHKSVLETPLNFTYKVSGEIIPTCIEQIRGIPYAKKSIEKPAKNLLLPSIVILGTIGLVIFLLNKFFKSYDKFKKQKS